MNIRLILKYSFISDFVHVICNFRCIVFYIMFLAVDSSSIDCGSERVSYFLHNRTLQLAISGVEKQCLVVIAGLRADIGFQSCSFILSLIFLKYGVDINITTYENDIVWLFMPLKGPQVNIRNSLSVGRSFSAAA